MMTSPSSEMQGRGIDVHKEGLGRGQGVDGPRGRNADAIGIHEGSSIGAIEGEAIEIDGVRTFDHVVCREHPTKQDRESARDGERGFSVRVHHDRLVVLQETGLPLSDGGLDGGNGVRTEGLLVDGVEDDIGVHLVQLRARYRPKDAGELAAMERNVGGIDVLAVEQIGSTIAG